MNIKSLDLQIQPSTIIESTSRYDVTEVMGLVTPFARCRSEVFIRSFVEKTFEVVAQTCPPPSQTSTIRTWSYDLNATLWLLSTVEAQVQGFVFKKDVPHLAVTFEHWNGRGHYLSPGGRFTLPMRFFTPNHDPQETEDWIDLFFGRTKRSFQICPECKGTGKVALFQFIYACSLCGDGKRL